MPLPPEITTPLQGKLLTDTIVAKLQFDLLNFITDTISNAASAPAKFQSNTVTTVMMLRIITALGSNSVAPAIPAVWTDVTQQERTNLKTILQNSDTLSGTVKTILTNAFAGTPPANVFSNAYMRLDRLQQVYQQALQILN